MVLYGTVRYGTMLFKTIYFNIFVDSVQYFDVLHILLDRGIIVLQLYHLKLIYLWYFCYSYFCKRKKFLFNNDLLQEIIAELQEVRHNLSVVSQELDQARVALQLANQTLNITVAHEFGMEVTLIATCSAVGVERVARLFWTHYKDKSPFPLDRYLFIFSLILLSNGWF